MPSDKFRKAELECLRLASDLTQMAASTQSLELKTHCLRMAKVWYDRACRGWADDPALPSVTVH